MVCRREDDGEGICGGLQGMKVELGQYVNRHEDKLKRLAWSFCWAVFARLTPRWLLVGWRATLARLFGGRIARGVRINGRARIWAPNRLTIGENSWIAEDANLYCVAPIEIGGKSYPLWYEVDERYGDALCDSRSDAFVTGLFLYALNRREDISYETPMTDELKLSIVQNFVLAVRDYDDDVYQIRLIGPTAPAIRKEKVSRLTGISCGVDSLYTVIRRMVKEGAELRPYAYPGKRHDIGNPQGYFETLKAFMEG